MTISTNTPVGELTTDHPATIEIFQRYRIDYCCGGRQTLGAACAEHGAPLDGVLSELEAALRTRTVGVSNWGTASLSDLVQHVIEQYHRPQRAEFARLTAMMAKVMEVHGSRWPALLTALAETLHELRVEASTHTLHEEQDVFPAIIAAEKAGRAAEALDAELDGLERDHATMGALLARLQALTDDYRAPEGACNTVTGLYHGLAELADGLRQHVALENNVLFPRAAALARSLQ